MTDTVQILGLGWVQAASMGRPGHIQNFDAPDQMNQLSGRSVLEAPYKSFGRMDHFSKLGFSAIAFAMADAGFLPVKPGKNGSGAKQRIALIAESVTGCTETDLLYQATLSRPETPMPSPALFAYTLASSFLGEAAIYFGLAGESYMIENDRSTGLTALAFAMDCLGTGTCDAAVCGVCNSAPGGDLSGNLPGSGAVFIVLAPDTARVMDGLPRMITRKPTTDGRFYIGNNEIQDLTGLVQKENI